MACPAAGVTVTTALDEDDGVLGGGTGVSLREAVLHAPDGSTIDFAAALDGLTLTLVAGQLAVGKNLAIDASALEAGITISGDHASRVFDIQSGRSLALIALTLTSGHSTGDGGTILNAGNLTLVDCELFANAANDGGGAIENSGTLTLTACTLANNTAEVGGGAIEHASGTLTATNCTFSGNTAGFGGAIDGDGSSTIQLYSCTLSANHATIDGGGLEETSGTLLLENTIIAGNTADDEGPDIKASSINTQAGVNLVSSTAGLGGIFSGLVANPNLAPLAETGGRTRTMMPMPDSPVIDAGGTTGLAVDQRGLPRIFGAAVDIGAAEDQGGEMTRQELDVLELRDLGQAVITASPYDIGNPDHVFDNNDISLYRSSAVNPAFIQVAFTAAKTMTGFRSLFSNLGDYRWKVEKADTQADMDSHSGTWAEIVPWQASAGDNVLRSHVLPAVVSARIYKLVAERLTGDSYVHINEWDLLGPVWTVSEPLDVRLDVLNQRDLGQAAITASPYDIGHPDLVFDGNAGTLYRSAEINPAFIQVAFTSPTTTTGFRTLFSNLGDYRWKVEKADTQTDMDSQSGSWAEIVPWQPSAGDDIFRGYTLPAAVSARIYKLVAERLTGGGYVHINEWELLGPVAIHSLEVVPAALELPHPGAWPYACIGKDAAAVAHTITGDVVWSSSHPEVAAVAADGTVTTTGTGTTVIHAGLGLLADSGDLTVTPPGPAPGDLAATAYHTTAHLTWDAGPGNTAGYVIYRRTADGSYPSEPTARVGPRQDHTDHGLTPGETYFWKIAAHDIQHNILTDFAKTSATLLASIAGLKRIAAPKLLIALYHGEMTPAEKDAAIAGLQLALDWYYRNSGQRFFMDATWMLIEAPVPDKGSGYAAIEADLRARGVTDGQYDLCFTTGADIGVCQGGYLIFNGTARASKALVCGVPYPAKDPGTNYVLTWAFTHEIHHAIDTMVDDAGGADMLYDHFPWNYPSPLDGRHIDWGPHYDGISKIMRVYDDYAGWSGVNHGDYIEVWDTDGDDLADSDPRVAMDEARFGSTVGMADSDMDGLSDGREYDHQVYTSLDPGNPDTDGDGRLDGADPQPLYAIPDLIAYTASPPVLDGSVEPKWSTLRTGYFFTRQASDFGFEAYANFDANYLYLAFRSTRPSMYYRLALDGSGDLGRYESDVRHPDADPGDRATWYADVYAEGNHIEISPFSPVASVYDVGAIPGSQVETGSSGGWYTTEVRIPRTLPHGCAYTYFPPTAPVVEGLQFMPGRIFGISVTLSDSPGDEFAGSWTGLFETHGFVDFMLSGTGDLDGDGLDAAAEATAQTDPLDPDTDGDGMSDGWEAQYLFDPLVDDANEDGDGDGMSNLDEFDSGTDPRDPTSRLRVISVTNTGPVAITWSTVYGRTYIVETSGTLDSPWTQVEASRVTELDGGPGTEDSETWVDPAAPPARNFYRVRVVATP